MTDTILVLSSPTDGEAELVRNSLMRCNSTRTVWIDLADFPLHLDVDVSGPPWAGQIRTTMGVVDLSEICGILYRRPTQYLMPQGMSAKNRRFAIGEARVGLGGLLSGLHCRWLNHPARVADAELKPNQLRIAHAVGLETPRTLFTNTPAATHRFAEEIAKPIVYKTLTGLDVERDGEPLLVFTTVVDRNDIDDSVRVTIHQFQEQVTKGYDLRVTMVGDRCFAVAIQTDPRRSAIDFRTDYASATYRPVDLEVALQKRLRAYLDYFQLGFGAFDLVVEPNGRAVFLECNANGQWGWIQDETGLPISDAMADYLIGV